VVAFFFTRNIEKEYRSTAKLSTGFTVKKESKTATGNDDYWESQVSFDDFIEMMKSEPTASMVSYQLLLHDLSEGKAFRTSGPLSLSRSEQDSAKTMLHANLSSFKLMSSFDEFEKRIMGLLDKKDYNLAKWVKEGALRIDRMDDTDYIKVEFLSEDPFLSAFVVNALSQEAIRYNNSLNSTTPEDSVQFFETEVIKKKRDLDEKAERLRRRPVVKQDDSYDTERKAKLAELVGYQMRLREEERRANELSSSLRSTKARIAAYDQPAKPVNRSESQKNAKLVELQNKINELNKIYVDNGSSDKKLAGTISKLRDQLQIRKAKLDSESEKVVTQKIPDQLIEESKRTEFNYDQTESRILSLKGKINRLKSTYSTVSRTTEPDSTVVSSDREHNAAVKEYASAVEKLKEAKNKDQLVGQGVKLLIPGKPSADPDSAKALATMAMVMIGTFILCLARIILGEYFRATGFWPLIGPNRSTYRKFFSRRATL